MNVGIALGSGSARGWAHIGVLEALAGMGIVPRVVAGTSIGAETYDRDVVYIGNGGSEDFAVGPAGEKRPAQREGRRPLQDGPAPDAGLTME